MDKRPRGLPLIVKFGALALVGWIVIVVLVTLAGSLIRHHHTSEQRAFVRHAASCGSGAQAPFARLEDPYTVTELRPERVDEALAGVPHGTRGLYAVRQLWREADQIGTAIYAQVGDDPEVHRGFESAFRDRAESKGVALDSATVAGHRVLTWDAGDQRTVVGAIRCGYVAVTVDGPRRANRVWAMLASETQA